MQLTILKWPEIGIQDDMAVADNGEAVDSRVVVANIVERICEYIGIKPLGFRR